LPYCQSANGAVDYDSSCSRICHRQSNPLWDPYRSDCSGFISWAWGLPPPGRVTGQFAPFSTSVSYSIDGHSLQPGDALNNNEHVIMFVSWNTPGSNANFMEEPGCSSHIPYAHAFSSAVSISGSSVYVSYQGASFTAIRYANAGSAGSRGGGPPCTYRGVSGECTSSCGSGHSSHSSSSGASGCQSFPSNVLCCVSSAALLEDAPGYAGDLLSTISGGSAGLPSGAVAGIVVGVVVCVALMVLLVVLLVMRSRRNEDGMRFDNPTFSNKSVAMTTNPSGKATESAATDRPAFL